MQQIQFIQTTPEEIKQDILQGVSNLIESLKKDFQPKEPIELLSREETANLLKINLTTLWSYTKKGKLQSYGIGNRVYYKRNEVMNALIQLKVKPVTT